MFRPNFRISNNLLQYIANIEASREMIKNAAIVPAWEAKFQEEALVRTVYHGTRLEGNELSQEQAERVINTPGTDPEKVASGAGIVGKARDIQEVINYRSALDWINTWGNNLSDQETPEYSVEMLKTLHSLSVHRIIAPNQCGTYRDQKVLVRGVESGQVVHRPPEPDSVPELVDEFLEWLNSPESRQVHVVFRAAITHYQLVNIHPFIEGNGRTARAMALALMYAEGYDVKRFFSLEQYFDNDIENYYLAIRSVQNSKEHELTYWLEYFAYGLAIELDRIKQQVLKLSQDFRLQQKLGQQVALSERQLIIMEYLQEQGKASSNDLNEILPMISTDTILRDLKDLIDKNLVKKHGVTKGVHYTLT